MRIPFPGRQSNRRTANYETTSTSDDEASPDLSDLSDMELERSIRSAWSNRSGWSAATAGAGGDNIHDDDIDRALAGAVGGASASSPSRRTQTNAVSARQVMEAMTHDLNQRPLGMYVYVCAIWK